MVLTFPSLLPFTSQCASLYLLLESCRLLSSTRMRQDFDVHPVLHVGMRWITIEITGIHAGWHVCCGSCLYNLWREMSKLGTLDLDEMPSGYHHDYHSEWKSRIDKKIKDKFVKRLCMEPADVDKLVHLHLKRPRCRSEIMQVLLSRNASSSARFFCDHTLCCCPFFCDVFMYWSNGFLKYNRCVTFGG